MPQFIRPDGPSYICSRKQTGDCLNRFCPFGHERPYRDNLGPLRCTLTVPPVDGGVMVDEAEVAQDSDSKAGAA